MSLRAAVLLMLLSVVVRVCFAADYAVGVYYFPGWKDNESHAPSRTPWRPIENYPDRKPLMGWYKEGAADVMQQQLRWMQQYGIEFVAFDWYFAAGEGPVLTHAIDTYRAIHLSGMPHFTLLWANHDKVPTKMSEWEAMVEYWCASYFKDDRYLTSDEKPVVFVMSSELLRRQARSFDEVPSTLLTRAQQIARHHGLKGIHFVAGVGSLAPNSEENARVDGYSSLSAYNFHNGPDGSFSKSYAELDLGYRENWRRLANSKALPLVVPITAGWDRRPWGGSSDSSHDDSVGSAEQFKEHLQAGREFVDKNLGQVLRVVGVAGKSLPALVVCCWNEFGEGSFVEPTEGHRFSYLGAIKSVFRSSKH